MKKVFALLVLLVLLAGCSAGAAPVMYIQPAELNEEEEAVAKLLGADMDQHLFDVVLDGTATLIKKNFLFNWRNRITVRVLPPVEAAAVAATVVHELAEQVHDDMAAALAEIKNEKLKMKN